MSDDTCPGCDGPARIVNHVPPHDPEWRYVHVSRFCPTMLAEMHTHGEVYGLPRRAPA